MFQCVLFVNDGKGRRISKSGIVGFKSLPLAKEFLIVERRGSTDLIVLVTNVIPVLLGTGLCTQHFILTTIETDESIITLDIAFENNSP